MYRESKKSHPAAASVGSIGVLDSQVHMVSDFDYYTFALSYVLLNSDNGTMHFSDTSCVVPAQTDSITVDFSQVEVEDLYTGNIMKGLYVPMERVGGEIVFSCVLPYDEKQFVLEDPLPPVLAIPTLRRKHNQVEYRSYNVQYSDTSVILISSTPYLPSHKKYPYDRGQVKRVLVHYMQYDGQRASSPFFIRTAKVVGYSPGSRISLTSKEIVCEGIVFEGSKLYVDHVYHPTYEINNGDFVPLRYLVSDQILLNKRCLIQEGDSFQLYDRGKFVKEYCRYTPYSLFVRSDYGPTMFRDISLFPTKLLCTNFRDVDQTTTYLVGHTLVTVSSNESPMLMMDM
jgi:hypothetical protein